jgi:thymidylate synthase (FAD)
VKIVEPYARMMAVPPGTDTFYCEDGVNLLRRIEWCGRISHRSEESQTEDSWKKFIPPVVMSHGDWSIVEHASVSVDMLVDRGITHEIVRHRLFSFTHESTRFVNYEKKMPPSFIVPLPEAAKGGTGDPNFVFWERAVNSTEIAYKDLISHGVSPQIARSVFPNALASRIIVTGNLRNWRHFLIMRTTKEAHPQMRQVTIPLLAEFKAKIPLLFDDIEPLQTQAHNLRLPR